MFPEAAAHRAIAATWRIECARIVATVARMTRDIGLAEECAQDALVAALEHWPKDGTPANPAAWLTTTAKHRALDTLRHHTLRERKLEELGQDLEAQEATVVPDFVDALDTARNDRIGDDLLRLMFTACHPVLPADARVALTLRLLGGLTTAEIARAFLVPEPTIAQRIVRAKKTLAQAKVPFELPPHDDLADRLGAVLEVIYLVFNEGYTASAGADWMRPALADEALRLGRVLATLAPEEPEAQGLVALMEIQSSRTAARTDAQGRPVLLKELRAQGNGCEVVLITAFASLDTAIEALRAGAGDLLIKPFRVTQALSAVSQGLDRARLKRENWVLRRALQQRTPAADALVGRSIVVKGLQAALARVAPVESTVLLTGESGTGKELAAMTLHRLGPEPDAPFVPVNCASVSPQQLEAELFGQPGRDGLFVYAQGGTLFLDEINELPLPLQAALLRVMDTRRVRPLFSEQEMPVRLRIVAATNRPLRAEVDAGRFRADLYWRLQVVEIRLPPLRAHKEDLPDLVAHFVATLAPRLGVPAIEVSEEEMRFLRQYDWPGNVRELRNLLERSLIVGALNVSALYQSLPRAPAAGMPAPAAPTGPTDLHTLEKQHILAVLGSVQGDKAQAAQLLGISKRTLERRFAEWQQA